MEQLIGRIVNDRYQIQSLLGRQVGRRTFTAVDLNQPQTVVLKLMLFGPDFTWQDLKLFEREAETLKAIDHAAIPKYFDSFEIDTELGKGFAFVQSYIPAKSLQSWAESGRYFSEKELRAIATQLLNVLTYLHSRQPPVMHRDIKPSNILLGDRSGHSPGQIYLVDFGSVQTSQPSGTITIVGTYGYMPPEQFGGRTVPASDLYSLGATLIYLLTRTHPADLPSRNGRMQFEVKTQVSDRFQAWLHCMVHPNIEQRFESAELALKALNDETFPLPSHSHRLTKPADSKVVLSKTDDYLKISIPPFSTPKKLRLIISTIGTTFLGWMIPLLLGLWSIEAFLLISPLCLWFTFSSWKRRLFQLFEQRQLLITQEEIRLTQKFFGLLKSRSSPRKDIIKVERLSYVDHLKKYKKNEEFRNVHTIVSTLKVWAGNQEYSIEDADFRPYKKLTELELDWLAVELSSWLDLPLYPPNDSTQVTTSHNQVVKTDGSPLHSNLVSPLVLPEIRRPEDAKCTITKDHQCIEVIVPEDSSYWNYLIWIVVGLCLGPLVVIPIAVVLFLLTRELVRRLFGRSRSSVKTILKIDNKTASLWKWREDRRFKLLNEAPRQSINSIQIVVSSSRERYYVQLKISKSPAIYAWYMIVGGRKFFLSRPEAYWLAYELSTWLKVPVNELEVIEVSSA